MMLIFSISLNLLAMVLSDAKIPFVSEEKALSRALISFLILLIYAVNLSLISDTREKSLLATLVSISAVRFACQFPQ
jgi:hypothetical protein